MSSLENFKVQPFTSSEENEMPSDIASPGLKVPSMLPRFLESSTPTKIAKSLRSTHLLESRPVFKFVCPKVDCDFPLSQEQSESSKNFEDYVDFKKLELTCYNKSAAEIKIKLPIQVESSFANQLSLTQNAASFSAFGSKGEEITANKEYYKYVDNISSLASIGNTWTNEPSFNLRLKHVLNTKLKSPIQIDLKKYKDLTEESRIGSVPSLKPILNNPRGKSSKLTFKSEINPQDQINRASKRVRFAQNKILIFYNEKSKA